MTIREVAERLPTDKLRRAAQRLLGDTSDAAWPVDEDTTRDTESIARAYLADHPADSEMRLDEEFLRSVGFVYEDLNGNSPYEWFRHPSDLIFWEFNGLYWLCNQLDQGGIHKEFKTRGDVRRVAKCLGITLEESK